MVQCGGQDVARRVFEQEGDLEVVHCGLVVLVEFRILAELSDRLGVGQRLLRRGDQVGAPCVDQLRDPRDDRREIGFVARQPAAAAKNGP